ncbi:MAG: major pilin protein fimA, partial [uncultured Thiotrichaceae bacterium]
MTFSIAARCPDSGQFGVAISSSSPCVASRCAFTRAGTGAALTQNITDPRLGPIMLDLLALGRSTEEAVAGAVGGTQHADW